MDKGGGGGVRTVECLLTLTPTENTVSIRVRLGPSRQDEQTGMSKTTKTGGCDQGPERGAATSKMDGSGLSITR